MLARLATYATSLALTACQVVPPRSPLTPPVGGNQFASADSGPTHLTDLRAGDQLIVAASELGCFSSSLIHATVALDSTGTWTLMGRAGFGEGYGLYPQPPMALTARERDGLDMYLALLRPADSTRWCSNHEVITLVLVRNGVPHRREVIDNSTCPDDVSGTAISLASLFAPAFSQAEAAVR